MEAIIDYLHNRVQRIFVCGRILFHINGCYLFLQFELQVPTTRAHTHHANVCLDCSSQICEGGIAGEER